MSAHRIPSDVSQSDWIIADPGTGNAINPAQSGSLKLTIGTTAETNTLVDPTKQGLRLTISVVSVGALGKRTITADTAVDRYGTVAFVLNNVDDVVVLESVVDAAGTLRWAMIYPDFVKMSQTALTATATVTAAQLLTLVLDGTPTAAATYTLPTALLLIPAMRDARVGSSFMFFVNNKSAGANTITIASGTGGTDDGTMTVAQNVIRAFLIIVTNVTAASEAYFCYGIE